ncbi:TetR/AcrR family transcriptional regulator [uncultured Duncaniella sp.]|uniref:TetR/AcrR family transcriptional regulator n=1 Tax=uncultured Duncaniella sp. TaxID=2768039 RepID=UPI0025AFD9AC|nr:TetR/AcrR family transcriptional regulator [uncultured Duncaniella sp.]
MITERNRGETEKRILEAVGRIVESDGFEKVGINAVANEAGVSKMLIYRYFSSIDGLLAAYIKQNDYWLNISLELPLEKGMLIPYVVQVYKAQIFQLRDNIVMRRLLRWELANNNDLISDIRAKREENGMSLIKIVSNLSGKPVKEIAEMASLLSASITYLALLSDIYPVYNGLDIADDKGWSDLIEGIEKIIKKYIE